LNASIAEGHPFIEMVRDHEIASILQECVRSGAPHSGLIETEPDKKLLGIMATSLGNNAGTVVLLQDLTKLRQLERVRSDFVANISHELRTPLTSLKLLTETLQSGNLVRTKHALSFLGKMDAEVDILIQMVNELAELSSIESGREKLDLSLLDITVVSSQIVDRLMEQVRRANLTLELDFPPDLPMVMADRRKMEQVIVNLLHNAIKFTPSKGNIIISACQKEEELCFSVKDTGIGVPKEDLTRIFERFYKVDRARTGPGTGLGLSIVKHIIEAHSGRVWVESTEGRGAIFTFCIPLLLKTNK
jgi:two-component system phosphate regulon sensor histidine kinase PhoR